MTICDDREPHRRIIPPLLLVPSLFGLFGRHGIHCKSRSCTILEDDHGSSPKKFFLFLGLALPCVVLVVTNVLIYLKVSNCLLRYQ